MRQLFVYLFLSMNIINAAFCQEIYRLIDPLTSSGSKSPYDGPPYARLGSTQFYYNTNWVYNRDGQNYNPDVDAAFAEWNGAGTVQFSRTSSSTALWCIGFYDDYGLQTPPYANCGNASVAINQSNFSIKPHQSQISLNTVYNWAQRIQDLANMKMDVQTTMGHEIGHIHGLAHPYSGSYTHNALAPLMAGGENEYFWNHTARSLRTADLHGTQFLQYHIWVPPQSPTLEDAINNSYAGVNINVGSGTQTVSTNLTVQPGVALSLNSGVTVMFGSAKKISVYGSLNANGTTFQGNGTAGYWNSLSFYSGSSGNIQNSTIRDAVCGIYTNNSNVTISNNTITNNSLYGISSLSNSNITVSNCTISNNGTGINAYSITATITGNSILNNTNYGINATNIAGNPNWYSNTLHGNGYAVVLNNTSPYIAYSTISDNAHGVVINSSFSYFCPPDNSRGYNAITCSATPLFKADNSSTVFMGYWSNGGYNSVFGSELPDMEARNSSGIWAGSTYWGSGQPAVYADGTSWIYTGSPLASDPNPGSCSIYSAPSSFVINSSAIKINVSSTLDDKAAKYEEALANGRGGYFQKAKETLLTLIDGEYDHKYSPLALLAFYEFTLNENILKIKMV